MLRLVSFTNTVAWFTKELDKTNLFVKFTKQSTVKFLIRVWRKWLVDFDSIKKTSVFTRTYRTVSWNVVIRININHNKVNSKQYTMLDLRFLDSTRNCKVKYE